jgi:hypothetical protein
MWRTGYSNELSTLFDELNLVEVIKIGRLRWLGQLFRMQTLGESFLNQKALNMQENQSQCDLSRLRKI